MLPESVPAGKPKLLDQIPRSDAGQIFDAIRTEMANVEWILCFILLSGKRYPRELDGPEVARFLTHPANQGKFASFAAKNQATGALLILSKDLPGKLPDDLGAVTRASPSRVKSRWR